MTGFSDPAALVDYAKSLDCIHCGLCLTTCPTYQLTGAESSSPRGRIHLMRAVAEGRQPVDEGYAEELSFCLLCRHCESVCPAGVQFGAMMEHARDAVARERPRGPAERLARRIGFGLLLGRRRALGAAVSLAAIAQRAGLLALAGRALGARGAALLRLPRLPPRAERRPLAPRSPARGAERATVAVLEGCVQRELYGRVNRATVASLNALGATCLAPAGAFCCGSLHAHNGELEGARERARAIVRAFEVAVDPAGRPVPIVVNSAGCGAHLSELDALFPPDDPWRARAAAVAARVRDFSEAALELLGAASPALVATGFPAPVAWDDPCHLCHGQGVRAEPRRLLDAIPGLERVELEDAESCCGSAGIYSILRPADAQAVFAAKRAALERSGARTLVTANPGCQLQWETGLAAAGSDVRVVHLAEVLARALAG